MVARGGRVEESLQAQLVGVGSIIGWVGDLVFYTGEFHWEEVGAGIGRSSSRQCINLHCGSQQEHRYCELHSQANCKPPAWKSQYNIVQLLLTKV